MRTLALAVVIVWHVVRILVMVATGDRWRAPAAPGSIAGAVVLEGAVLWAVLYLAGAA